ncbi:MAG TPA: type I-C CRISPR-associated endonuclease Cas1c [Thermogutta sp.]|nr:type I-C CRISPR-associated endonuclease Cas1c [Thermogutta sp.]
MKHHLNTLFVTTQGTYLRKSGEAVAVCIEKQIRLRIPLINLGGIVCFGRVSCSPALLAACARAGISVSFFTEFGRFLAVCQGFTSGNVLLRRTQYRWADDPEKTAILARMFVMGKIANTRSVLRRAAREHEDPAAIRDISQIADQLTQILSMLEHAGGVELVRGLEGQASAAYFSVFNHLILTQKDHLKFTCRSRRPPRDPVNALLSFLYSLLVADVRGACEASGLDAGVGFLHRDRPGRPGLALDLMEEFRAILADRVALTLINRQQIKPKDFINQPGGTVVLTDSGRRRVLEEYQARKNETITHPFLNEKMTLGLVPHIQARLLARVLRGDLDTYPPFVLK